MINAQLAKRAFILKDKTAAAIIDWEFLADGLALPSFEGILGVFPR
jgi:hypothetical protein